MGTTSNQKNTLEVMIQMIHIISQAQCGALISLLARIPARVREKHLPADLSAGFFWVIFSVDPARLMHCEIRDAPATHSRQPYLCRYPRPLWTVCAVIRGLGKPQ